MSTNISIKFLAILFLLGSLNVKSEEQLPDQLTSVITQFGTLNRGNIAYFKGYLPGEISNWFEQGLISSNIKAKLNFDFNYGAAWNSSSVSAECNLENTHKIKPLTNIEKLHTLTNETEIIYSELKCKQNLVGLPFQKTPALKAEEILWNSVYAQAQASNLYFDGNLTWTNQKEVVRTGTVSGFKSIYQIQNSPNETKNLMNFRLNFNQPNLVKDFSFVNTKTFAFNLDSIAIYSPLLGKVRLLPNSSMNDTLFGGVISVNDFDVASSKPIKSAIIGSSWQLVPFLSVDKISGEAFNGEIPFGTFTNANKISGKQLQVGISNSLNSKISTSASTTNYAPWAPTNFVLVPRKVYVVENEYCDPYSTISKELLFIDVESFIPYYKMLYDRTGEKSRTIMGIWARFGGNIEFAAPIGLLAVNSDLKSASLFRTEQIIAGIKFTQKFNPFELKDKDVENLKTQDDKKAGTQEEGAHND